MVQIRSQSVCCRREIHRRYASSDGGSQSDCWFRGGRTHGSTPQPFIFALMCVLNTTRNPIWTFTGSPASTLDVSARLCFASWIWGDVSRYVQCWKRDCGRYFIHSFASHVDLLSVSRVSNIAWQCELLFCWDFDASAVIWANLTCRIVFRRFVRLYHEFSPSVNSLDCSIRAIRS